MIDTVFECFGSTTVFMCFRADFVWRILLFPVTW